MGLVLSDRVCPAPQPVSLLKDTLVARCPSQHGNVPDPPSGTHARVVTCPGIPYWNLQLCRTGIPINPSSFLLMSTLRRRF